MRVQSKKTDIIYEVNGSYFDKKGHSAVYLADLEGRPVAQVNFSEFLEDFVEIAPEPTDFNVIATSKLAKLEIADQDYTEGDKKYFTFDEACAIEKKLNNGWRLPTRSEWALICEEFGQKDGVFDVETLMQNLNLQKNGVLYPDDDEPSYAGYSGDYWSSTPVSDGASAYVLNFYGTGNINPSYNANRYSGRSVRCVRDLK